MKRLILDFITLALLMALLLTLVCMVGCVSKNQTVNVYFYLEPNSTPRERFDVSVNQEGNWASETDASGNTASPELSIPLIP